MEVIERQINYKQSDGVYKIFPLGCLHLGTKHCAEEAIKKKVAEIKNNPTALWLGMGDYGEFIVPSDKRWDVKGIADWLKDDEDNIAEVQVDKIEEILSPIASQCVGLLGGNHEDSIRRYLHVDVHKNLCKRLGLPNLGYSAWVRFRFARENSTERHVVKGVFSHGSGFAITPSAKMSRLQRFMNAFDARIYGHGHVHDIIIHTVPYLELTDANIIKQKERVGAMTGCWFTTYSQGISASYGERKNYPPTSLGCPVFVIDPTKDEVRVEG